MIIAKKKLVAPYCKKKLVARRDSTIKKSLFLKYYFLYSRRLVESGLVATLFMQDGGVSFEPEP